MPLLENRMIPDVPYRFTVRPLAEGAGGGQLIEFPDCTAASGRARRSSRRSSTGSAQCAARARRPGPRASQSLGPGRGMWPEGPKGRGPPGRGSYARSCPHPGPPPLRGRGGMRREATTARPSFGGAREGAFRPLRAFLEPRHPRLEHGAAHGRLLVRSAPVRDDPRPPGSPAPAGPACRAGHATRS